MRNSNSNSGHNIIYKDYSTSGIGASTNQSSADPTSLANIMHQRIIVTKLSSEELHSPNLMPADKNEK